jgi:PAS domain S-box-containing protein
MGAVDYVPVPVIPEILRAKVKVFVELYRKTQQLEQLNAELEQRVAQRTAELEASTKRLIESETRRNLALVAGQMGSWDWDMVQGDCLCDDGLRRILGLGPEQPLDERVVRNRIHPEDWQRIRASFGEITAESQSLQMEFRVVRADGRLRWCLGSTAASFDEAGALVRLSGVVVDITDRKEAEERNALLAREVDHRARNTLTIVQSILRLTREPNVDRYIKAVEGRIRSLSQAHTLLAQSRWQGADLHKLVTEEMAAYRAGTSHAVNEHGPDVLLDAPTAQTIALALHELVTNAAKHGALSSSAGQVEIAWELAGGELALSWSENGGPRPQLPTTRGFGLNVIHASIEGQLGGRVELDWADQGLRCRLTFPFGGSSTAPFVDPMEPAKAEPCVQARLAPGTCILVVEDEAMVAMLVKDALDELGMEMDGPFTSLTSALAAAQTTHASAALLDVNLAGEFVYPVADVLRARGIPIVFTTGYGGEDVDARYGDVPVLTKPFQVEQLHDIMLNHAGRTGDGPRAAAPGAGARTAARAVATS